MRARSLRYSHHHTSQLLASLEALTDVLFLSDYVHGRAYDEFYFKIYCREISVHRFVNNIVFRSYWTD